MFDLTINLGNLLTILATLVSFFAYLWSMKGDIKLTGVRLTAIEEKLHELREVVVDLARQDERIGSLEQRIFKIETHRS